MIRCLTDADHRGTIPTHVILSAPRSRSTDIIREFIYIYQRAMDMTMQSKFMPCSNYFLRDLRIPVDNFTDEIKTRFRILHLFKNRVDGTQGKSAVQLAAAIQIGQGIVMSKEREDRLVINAEQDARSYRHKTPILMAWYMHVKRRV